MGHNVKSISDYNFSIFSYDKTSMYHSKLFCKTFLKVRKIYNIHIGTIANLRDGVLCQCHTIPLFIEKTTV